MSKVNRWVTVGVCTCMVLFFGFVGALAGGVNAAVPDDVLFTKTAVASGTNITYTLTISNGDGSPRHVTVDDQMPNGVEIGESCLVSEPDLLEDVLFSRADNRLIASAVLTPAQAVTIACPAVANVGISVDKSAVQSIISSGEAVSFTITLTNSGAITLTNIAIEDMQAACDFPPEQLAPAAVAQLTCVTTNVQTTFTNVLTASAEAIIVNTAVVTIATGNNMSQTASAQTTIVVSDTAVGQDSVTVIPPDVILADSLVVNKTAVQNGTTLTYTMSVTNTTAEPVSLRIEDGMNGIQADYCLAPDGDFIRENGVPKRPIRAFTRIGLDVLDPNETIQFVCVATVDPQIQIEKTPMIQTITAGDMALFTITLTGTSNPTSTIQLHTLTIADSVSADCEFGVNDGIGVVVSHVCSVPITTTTTTVITATADIAFSNQFTATIIDPQTLQSISGTAVTGYVTRTFMISDSDDATVIVNASPRPSVSLTKTVTLINDNTALLWAVTVGNNEAISTTVRVIDQIEGMMADYCLDPNGDPFGNAPLSAFAIDVELPPSDTVQFVCVSSLNPTVEITLTPSGQTIDVGQAAAFTLSYVANGLPFTSVEVETPGLDCMNGSGCFVPDVTADFTQPASIVATLPITNNVQVSLIDPASGFFIPDTTVTATATYTAVFSDEDTAAVTVINPLPVLNVDKTATQDSDTLTWTVTITNDGRVPATLYIDDRMQGIQATYCLDPNGDPLLDQDGNERGALTFFIRTGEDVLQPNETIQFVCVAAVDPTLTIAKTPSIQTVMTGDTATFNVAITATVSPTSQLQFQNVTISDSVTPTCEQAVITPTASGFNDTYSCSETMVTADIANTITATADIQFSNKVEVSAIDPDTFAILVSTTVTDKVTTQITVSDTAVALVDARSTAEEGISLSKQSMRDGNEVTYTISLANSNLASSPPLTVTDRFPPAFTVQSCDYMVMSGESQEITNQIDDHILTHVVQLPAGTEAEIVCRGTLTAALVIINTPRKLEVRDGGDAIFDVTLFNTSGIDLNNVVVSSNIVCTAPSLNPLPANSEAESICTNLDTTAPLTVTAIATGTAVYINIVSVHSGIEEPFFAIADIDEFTTTLSMSDTAAVTILSEPGIVLSKTVDYHPILDAPDMLTYTISVTNNGTLSATYAITDTFPTISSHTSERMTAQCNGGEPSYLFTQTVSLEPSMGATFVCTAEINPALVVTRTALNPIIESGEIGQFTTDIHNTGNTELLVDLSDDATENQCRTNDYPGLYPSKIEACSHIYSVVVTRTKSSTAIITGVSTIENTVSGSILGWPDSQTTAEASFSVLVTDTSTAIIQAYAGELLDIEKSTNGFDADDPSNLPDDLIVLVGEPIQWDYIIRNQGNFTFTDLILSDNDPNIGQISESHCSNTLALLQVGQTITCTVTSTAVEGQYVNIAQVIGTLEDTEIALSATDRSAYLGITPTTTLGTVGDIVFHDINNDGRQNPTEPGLAGVSIILTLPDDSTQITSTDEDGRYQFRNLLSGAYRLDIDTASLPNNKLGAINSFDPDQTDDVQAGNNTTRFTISSTMTTTVQNFGYHLLNTVGRISGTVFHDVTGGDIRGLSGVRVNLLLPDGSIRPSVTDENGRYQFTELPLNATYDVVVITDTLPISKQNGINSVAPDLTTDDRAAVTLSNEIVEANNLNFGYLLSSIVGGVVYNDLDGIPTSGDEQGMPDILVRLRNQNGEIVDEEVTGQSGSYSFRDRPVGIYTVEIVTSTLPTSKNGVVSTYPDPNPVTLTADNLVNNQNQFGFRPLFGRIDGLIYHDTNRSNRFDSWETVQPNAIVVLTNLANNEIRTAVTTADGQYRFDEIIVGEYTISLLDETVSAAKQCLSEQTDRINITVDQRIQTASFGTISCPNGTVGNRVWWDEDKDGVYDPSNDIPLAGVHISLTLLLPIGTPSGVVLTTTTDVNGIYGFNNLPLGGYEVAVDVLSLPEERQDQAWVINVDPYGVIDGRSTLILTPDTPSNFDQDFAFSLPQPTAVRLTAQRITSNSTGLSVLLLGGVTLYLFFMSSFSNPHHMYLFDMTNGKQKLTYGASPEDALDILRMRLNNEEMALIIPDQYKKVSQRKMQDYVGNLG